MLKRATATLSQRQHGLSIVELMVGVAIGLFVVAAATMLVTTQLSDSRRLMLETQVQQDLRASADIITRELRRAGHWSKARYGVWYPGKPPSELVETNPYLVGIKPTSADDSAFVNDVPESSVVFAYSRSGSEDDAANATVSGFRLAQVNGKGVIQTQLGDDNWLALTDGNTLNVTKFSLTMNRQPIPLPCAKPCPGGGDSCWPVIEVRDLRVLIEGEAANDRNVRRSVDHKVRLRNDAFDPGTCPA